MLSNIHPIIAVTNAGGAYVTSLLNSSKGMRCSITGPDAKFSVPMFSPQAASGVVTFAYVLDAVVVGQSSIMCASLLAPGGIIAQTLPPNYTITIPAGALAYLIVSGTVHAMHGKAPEAKDFGYIIMQFFARAQSAAI